MERDGRATVPLGVIPAGSGNSFARDLDLLDPLDASDAIINGHQGSLDLVEISLRKRGSSFTRIVMLSSIICR